MPVNVAAQTNLPSQITKFIGRDREIAEVRQCIAEHRLVTLTGAGGRGKTRLAIQVATTIVDQFPDGAWFIDLAAAYEAKQVPHAVTAALRVPDQVGSTVTDTLIRWVAERKCLLIIDNIEHLAEAVAGLCESLMANCPQLSILATGRSVLDLDNERIYRVPSMTMPDPKVSYEPQKLEQFEAVRLFIDRATISDPEFEISRENSQTLAAICHRIDGIPLAIELAAARVGSMSLAEVQYRIDERFESMKGGSTIMPRQQTLRAMIAWSYDLLTETEQMLLRRVSVFANGWDRAAAEAVCGDPTGYRLSKSTVPISMEDLVDHAIVQVEESTGRYKLLETVRTYAQDALDETLESEAVRERHLAYFAEMTKSCELHLNGPDTKEFLARLDVEHENVRAAIDWGLKGGSARTALALANSLSTYYQVRGRFEEGLATYSALIKLVDDDADPLSADAFGAQAILLCRQGQFGSTRQMLASALHIYELLDDKHGKARSYNTLGVVALQLKEFEPAAVEFKRSLELFRQIGDERRIAMTLNNLGILSTHLGDVDEAKSLYEEALRVNKAAGNQRFEAGNLTNLADLEWRHGDAKQSRILARQACLLHLQLDDLQNLQETFEVLGAAELKCGRPYIAAILFANKEAIMTELGTSVTPLVIEEYRQNVEATRLALGDDTFRAAFTEGREMAPIDVFRASLEDF